MIIVQHYNFLFGASLINFIISLYFSSEFVFLLNIHNLFINSYIFFIEMMLLGQVFFSTAFQPAEEINPKSTGLKYILNCI